MEVLKAAVCGDNIFVGKQGSSLGEQGFFVFEVLLEVIVAKFLVDFEVVGVVLASFLETLPNRSFLHGVNIADSVELVLQFAIASESAVYVVGVFGQCVDFVDDSVFAFEVCSLDSFLLGHPCSLFRFQSLDDEGEFVVLGHGLCSLLALGSGGRFMEHAVVLAQSANVVRADFRCVFC